MGDPEITWRQPIAGLAYVPLAIIFGPLRFVGWFVGFAVVTLVSSYQEARSAFRWIVRNLDVR